MIRRKLRKYLRELLQEPETPRSTKARDYLLNITMNWQVDEQSLVACITKELHYQWGNGLRQIKVLKRA